MSYYVYVHHIFVLNWLHKRILSIFSVWIVECQLFRSRPMEVRRVTCPWMTSRTFWRLMAQNEWQKEGYGWFPLFAVMTFACVWRYCVHWFGGTHSSRDSSAVHCMLTTISSDLKFKNMDTRTECSLILDKDVMYKLYLLSRQKKWFLMFLIDSSHPSCRFFLGKNLLDLELGHPHGSRIEFDCRPGAIAQSLALREPKYQEIAALCSDVAPLGPSHHQRIYVKLPWNTPSTRSTQHYSNITQPICHRLWLLFTSWCLRILQETAAYCHFGREAVTKTLVLKWKNIPGCFQVNLCVGVL